MNAQKFFIVCKSEIKGSFAPTAHPSFDSISEANIYASRNIRETEFRVITEEQKASLGF